MTEEKENCNFQQNYNVFGLDDKPCCYLYHKYCDEIDSCYFKRCKRLEQENKELKNIIKIHDSTKYDYYKLMKENEELHIKYAGCNTANSAIQEENKQLRSALEEIKNIILTYKSKEWNCFNDMDIKLEQISKVINEVLL